jgi:hypothetical protein
MSNGNGRVYTLTLSAIDENGAVSYADFKVQVPRWPWGWYSVAQEDGTVYEVDGQCSSTRATVVDSPEMTEETRVLPENSLNMRRFEPDLTVYPNPFATETNIRFDLPEAAAVTVEIFNLQGRRVRRLLSENMPEGRRLLQWDGRTDGGQGLPAGLYLLRMKIGEEVSVRKVSLQRF